MLYLTVTKYKLGRRVRMLLAMFAREVEEFRSLPQLGLCLEQHGHVDAPRRITATVPCLDVWIGRL